MTNQTADVAVATNGRCCEIPEHGMSADRLQRDVGAFSALANDTRYELLRLLNEACGEVCACNLVPHLPVNQSATSRALSVLHQAGLVTRRKEGRWRYYRITSRAAALLDAIDASQEGSQ